MTTTQDYEYELAEEQLFYNGLVAENQLDKDKLFEEVAKLQPTKELLDLYDLKYIKLNNQQCFNFTNRQIRCMNLYKKYIHLKTPAQLQNIPLEKADEFIKNFNNQLFELANFDYENYIAKMKESDILFFFNRD